MFEKYIDVFDEVINEAKKSDHIIRKEYMLISEIIKSYVKSNNLIISNPNILYDKKKNTIGTYVLYGTDMFKHANDLSNKISSITIYVLMYTNIKNEDFSITIHGIPIIQLYNIPKKLIKAISPVQINGINMYPPEFELIDIYRKLYSPHYYDEWEDLYDLAHVIQEQLYDRIEVLGSDDKKTQKNSNNSKNSNNKQ